jgi:hypothetical protein
VTILTSGFGPLLPVRRGSATILTPFGCEQVQRAWCNFEFPAEGNRPHRILPWIIARSRCATARGAGAGADRSARDGPVTI